MSSFFKDLLYDYTGQFQWGTFLLLVFLLLLLVIVIVLAVMGTVYSIRNTVDTNRFITSHKITRGTVTRYYMREGEDTTTVLPIRCGGGSILFPHHIRGEQQHYVELCCVVGSEQYLLQFAISEKDYESEAVGSEIAIPSGWFCKGYELIAEQ